MGPKLIKRGRLMMAVSGFASGFAGAFVADASGRTDSSGVWSVDSGFVFMRFAFRRRSGRVTGRRGNRPGAANMPVSIATKPRSAATRAYAAWTLSI